MQLLHEVVQSPLPLLSATARNEAKQLWLSARMHISMIITCVTFSCERV